MNTFEKRKATRKQLQFTEFTQLTKGRNNNQSINKIGTKNIKDNKIKRCFSFKDDKIDKAFHQTNKKWESNTLSDIN